MIVLKDFSFYFCANKDYTFSVNEIENFLIPKTVTLPHDIALSVTDYQKAEDLYYGCNVFKTQDFEDVHAFYCSEFEAEPGMYLIRVNRVDVFSEIYLNGEKVLTTNNAFIGYETKVQLRKKNKLTIHLLPTMIEASKVKVPCGAYAQRYNGAALYVRKPAHSFAWDIMPRNILGGIFDEVQFIPYKSDKICETYFFTESLETDNCANVTYACNYELAHTDDIKNYTMELIGECGESRFYNKDRLWSNFFRQRFQVKDCRLWDVKNFGDPNLYTLTSRLYYKGELVDEKIEKVGIRTIELLRTSCCDETGGEFVFKINGRETFVLGTNWIPSDALYSQATVRMRKNLQLLDEIGCNMVRVWGGGIYEPDEFYQFCDEHGILVWQDFMMACAAYPQDEWFLKEIRTEALYTVKRLRNHPSIALWSGDNECDYFATFHNPGMNPNENRLTREIIPQVLFEEDPNRPYLPSSPYYDEAWYKTKQAPSENHCWGVRDFFKSDYYKTCENATFISEIGYVGIPSEKSLKKFISEEKLYEFYSDEHVCHLVNPTAENPFYIFRADQNLSNVKNLFGKMPEDSRDIPVWSQIVQAEAVKYFIERMRIRKNVKHGIMFWNLIDGWPVVADALVDYFYEKKLAYDYVLKSQQYLCMIMDETEDGILLGAVNDTDRQESLHYKVSNAVTGEKLYEGECTVEANGLWNILFDWSKDRVFYLIEWETSSGKSGKNHFVSNIQNVSLDEYLTAIRKCGIYNIKF